MTMREPPHPPQKQVRGLGPSGADSEFRPKPIPKRAGMPSTTSIPFVCSSKTASQPFEDRIVLPRTVPPQASAAVKNYKVQIGRFADRGEAQTVAGKLKAEEQFEPWILR